MPSTPSDPTTASNAAFEALYRAQFKFVWRAVRAMGVNPASAEDVTQEVFVAACRKHATYDRSRSERAWLFGIARNEVLRLRRKTARYDQRIRQLQPHVPPLRPDQVTEMHEAATLLQTFLSQLDEPVRLSFVLSELEGLNGREAAQAMGVPVQTHYSRVRAARRRLESFATRHKAVEPRDGTRG